MTVERSTHPVTPKAPAAGGGHGVKGKGHAAGEAAAPEAGDSFSALLQMLGANEDGLAMAAPAEASLVPADVTAVPLLPTDKAQPEVVSVDPAMLLAQSLQHQPIAPQPETSEGKGVEAGLAIVEPGLADTLSAEAAAPLAQLAPEPPAAPALARGGEQVRPEAGEAVAKAAVGKVAAPSRNTRSVVAETVVAAAQAAPAAAELRTHQMVNRAGPRAEPNASPAPAVLTAAMGEGGFRRAERVAERSMFGQAGSGEGSWGHQALLAAGRTETSTVMAEPVAGMSPEVAVAEQVQYWIENDIQNAELKLDGLGASAVEVSISLQGNEARVEFRTDQAQARQVLEGAMDHLKDLLGNEGLVLSGVSVGSSGAEGSAARQRNPQPNGRAAVVAAPQLPTLEASGRPVGLSGRSVDLFV